jgi:pimeloyl-ACP methyl ester carboxylesterase
LHIERAGSGSPVVLLHGLGASWVSWSQIIPALAEHHEIIAPDLPGHGQSPPMPCGTKPTVEALTEAIEAALDRALPEPPPIVGNSLGGEIALELAVRGKARKVLALSPSGLSTSLERFYIKNALRLGHQVTRLLRPWAKDIGANPAARSALFALIRSRPWRMTSEEATEEVRNLARTTYLNTLIEVEDRKADNLEKIGCPVTIAFGTADRLLGAHQGPRFIEAIRGAELKPLPGLGHVPMSDDPELVANLILDFLGTA